MKLTITFGLAIMLGFTSFTGVSYSGTVALPFQTKGELKAKCKAAGGDFTSAGGDYSCWGKKGAVLCNKNSKKCLGDCAACGTKAMTKSLPEIVGEAKPRKRPKVLQESGGAGESGDVNPTILNGDPRKTPTGNMPDIKDNSTIQ